MKTLLLTLEFPPFKGGVANYYGNLVKYWPVDEHISVLDNSRGALAGSGFLSWRKTIKSLRHKIASDGIDYVLIGNILPLGTAAALLSLVKPFKFGVFLHGLDWTYANRNVWKRFLTRFIMRRSDRLICVNSYVADSVRDVYPKIIDKIVVINPGVAASAPDISQSDLDNLDSKYGTKDKLVLFSLGRLVKRKGFDAVIKALAKIGPGRMADWIYFIAGEGKDGDYLRSLVPPELTDKIIFLGSLKEDDKWLWLKRCDIFLMPSRDIAGDFEGFGIVYLEANLSGRPVIAGRSGGVEDAVEDGLNGLLVDPENIDELAESIERLASDKELRENLGEQGFIRAKDEFNWDRQIGRLASAIKS